MQLILRSLRKATHLRGSSALARGQGFLINVQFLQVFGVTRGVKVPSKGTARFSECWVEGTVAISFSSHVWEAGLRDLR